MRNLEANLPITPNNGLKKCRLASSFKIRKQAINRKADSDQNWISEQLKVNHSQENGRRCISCEENISKSKLFTDKKLFSRNIKMYAGILGNLDIDLRNVEASATRNLDSIAAAQKLIMRSCGSKEEGAKFENLSARSTGNLANWLLLRFKRL